MDLHARGSVIDGKYTIVAKLREGGMGAIYKVHHNLLDEVRVIKVMRPQAAEQDEMRRRFGQEAKIVTRLKHHNIASVYDFAIDDEGTAYIVMEYVDGVNLAEVMRAVRPVPVPFVLEVARQALDALAYLHRKNIAHRDISPDNIMCTEEDGQLVIKLVDLGIAKDLQATGTATKTGLFLGKLKYASPEQLGMIAEGQTIDGRSDLYSLAIVMYQLLTNQMPIAGETAQALIAGHLFHAPITFEQSDPNHLVPDELRGLIMRALQKERGQRWATADEFRDAIVALQQKLPLANATDMRTVLRRAREAAPEAEPEVSKSAQERVARQFSPGQTTARTVEITGTPTVVEAPAAATAVMTERLTVAAAPSRHNRWPMAAVIALAIVAVAGWLFAIRGHESPAVPSGPVSKQVVANVPPAAASTQQAVVNVVAPTNTDTQLASNSTGDVLEKAIRSAPPAQPRTVTPEPQRQRVAEPRPKTVEKSPSEVQQPLLPAPKPAAQPAPPVLTTPAPAPASVAETPKGPSDEDLIRRTIAEFVRAQEALDPLLYARVFPSAPATRIAQSFSQLRSQSLELTIEDVQIAGRRATVRASETRSIVPKAGAEQHLSRKTTIVLEKGGDSWIVSALR